jgi:type II secretory pathway component PulJ
LLVALAVSAMILVTLAGLLQQGQQAYRAGAGQVEAQQDARVAVERLARELRGAGVDPTGAGFPPLVNLRPTGFTIQSDLNGDGVIRGNRETVTYSLTGSTLRRNAGGGAQPLINGVESLAFTYLDGNGRPTKEPREIRTVVIALATRPAGGGPGGVSMTTQVRLRNR